ncbi:MAG: serine/threonine protein phosphatase [Alteromonadaceae bacterium]|nr:MAG: serine/threonine protein phosphatase [Alteromonadaceae bacterium]
MHLSRYSAATDVGLQRSNNEDYYLSCPNLGLWVVADGMGGHAAGEVASAIVGQTIRDEVHQGHPLADAIQNSHRAVLSAAACGQGGQGMGSTAVALQVKGHHFKIAWVGDSRAYKWSPKSNTPLNQLTTDHSYVQMLYQSGAISEDELDTHPEKNIITQCLGSIELDSVTVDTVDGSWGKSDWIILCSDGLSDAISSTSINTILTNAGSVQVATKELIEAALAAGGKDNITVTVVEYPGKISRILRAISNIGSKIFKLNKN